MRPIWSHQAQTADFAVNVERIFDGSDPGTGKTRGHIEAYKRTQHGRLLVLCPTTLMHAAWARDLSEFAPDMSFSLATAAHREEAFQLKTDAVILNHDGVKWLAKEGKKYIKQFGHVVIDESSAYKWASSMRSKAARFVCKNAKYVAALNGTPFGHTVTEVHHQMLLVDHGRLLGSSFTAFRNAVQIPRQNGPSANHLVWNDKPGIAAVVAAMMAPRLIRHAFEDVMSSVPANHQSTLEFDLPPSVLKQYMKLEAELVLAVEDAQVSAIHAASLRTKLLQLASGAIYIDPQNEDRGYKVIDRSRYKLIVEQAATAQHSVVFFNWQHQRDELAKEFAASGARIAIIDGKVPQHDRIAIVNAYQSGEYDALLLHPKTGAHGLTLTRGTQTIVASPIYEADVLKQMIHRIYRGGQDKVTNTVFVQARNTVEKAVYERLQGRYASMTDLLQAARDQTKRRR